MPDQRQPAILPATLPAGTRTRYGNEATSELTLDAKCGVYCGHFAGFSGTLAFGVVAIDWDLVAVQAAVPAEEDRPIQAGDWVEVTSGNDSLPLSSRHAVRASWEDQYGDKYLDLDGFGLGGWDLDRFRRVDGPHPEKTPLEQRVESILYGVDPGISEQGTVSRVTMRGGQIESIESVPVGTGNAQSSGMGEAPKRDPYTEHRLNVDERADTWLRTTAESARRSLRWEQAEKPRVTNAADQRELRKPHPWSEFDELESR